MSHTHTHTIITITILSEILGALKTKYQYKFLQKESVKKKKKKKDNWTNGATVSFGEMKYALFSWERGKGDFDGWHF